jgi:hypothetical protein
MRFTRLMRQIALGGVLAGAGVVAACGGALGPSSVQASLEAPQPRQARVALMPALDVSALYDPAIADRIAIDDIVINLADARLLGADPRIPAGGLKLIHDPRVLQADGGSQSAIELPFPKDLLDQDDLAVYIRLDKAIDLEGASVVVHARVYAAPFKGQSLTAAPDPDGDPAEKGGMAGMPGSDEGDKTFRRLHKQSPDPDGDPARCAPDPDGDPALPKCIRAKRQYLTGSDDEADAATSGRFVRVELRGSDVADLVSSLNRKTNLDVVIGIPASRWLTRETMARIDQALANDDPSQPTSPDQSARDTKGIVVGSTSSEADKAARMQHAQSDTPSDASGYRLLEEMAAGRLKIYR